MKIYALLGTLTAALYCCGAMTASAQQSPQARMKSCAQEWDASKASKRTGGQTYRDFQRECLSRHGGEAAGRTDKSPAAAPREAPSSTIGSAPARPAPAASAAERAKAARAAVSEGSSNAAEVQRSCPSDTIVWGNPGTKVYHFSGSRFYGQTRTGKYMCRSESERAGFRAAKNEQAPESR
jgi:hypothetical protein